MKILVVGGFGFVGQALIDQLRLEGHDVTALSRTQKDADFPVVKLDLLNKRVSPKILEKFEVLVSLAWETTPGEFWTSTNNTNWRKVTLQLFSDFQDVGGRYFLGLGSCAEYDWSFTRLEARNPVHLNPKTLYGKEKLKCFQEISLSEKTTKAAWGRLFSPFGPGENKSKLIPLMSSAHINKTPFKVNNPDSEFDFIYIKDAANILSKAIKRELTGAFNVGTGRPTSIRSLVTWINNYFGGDKYVQMDSKPGSPSTHIYADLSELNGMDKDWDFRNLDEAMTEYLETLLKREGNNEIHHRY